MNRKVTLTDLNLGPNSASYIKNILLTNNKIAVLNLNKNLIGDKGARKIA